ncbi:MAG: Assimilatory nitrate reductase large subunit, partial [uncultured Actinomycetospora sp.]
GRIADHHPLPVLLPAVRHDPDPARAGRRAGARGNGRELPDQPGRALREGPVVGGAAGPPRPADHPAGARPA